MNPLNLFTKSKPQEPRVLTIIRTSGTDVDGDVQSYLQASDNKDKAVLAAIADSLIDVGRNAPVLTLSSIMRHTQEHALGVFWDNAGRKSNGLHAAVLHQTMASITAECAAAIMEHVDINMQTTSSHDADDGKDVAHGSVEQFPSEFLQYCVNALVAKDQTAEIRTASRKSIAALGTAAIAPVVACLLEAFPDSQLAAYPQWLGALNDIAQHQGAEFAPFFPAVISKLLPVLHLVKTDALRADVCRSLVSFSEACLSSRAARLQDASTAVTESVTAAAKVAASVVDEDDSVASKLGAAALSPGQPQAGAKSASQADLDLVMLQRDVGAVFETVMRQWFPALSLPAAREAALSALGEMIMLLSKDKLEETLHDLLVILLSLSKTFELSRFVVTRSIACGLHAGARTCGRVIVDLVRPLMAALLPMVCTPPDMKDSNAVRNFNEVHRCFEVLASVFAEEVMEFLLHKMEHEQNAYGSLRRVGALSILRHLIGRMKDLMPWRGSITGAVRSILDDRDPHVRRAIAHAIMAMGQKGFLSCEQHGPSLVMFLVDLACLPLPATAGGATADVVTASALPSSPLKGDVSNGVAGAGLPEQGDKMKQGTTPATAPHPGSAAANEVALRALGTQAIGVLCSTQSMDAVAWPLLVCALMRRDCLTAIAPLCKGLSVVARRLSAGGDRDEVWPAQEGATPFCEAPPTLADIVARLLVLVGCRCPNNAGGYHQRVLECIVSLATLKADVDADLTEITTVAADMTAWSQTAQSSPAGWRQEAWCARVEVLTTTLLRSVFANCAVHVVAAVGTHLTGDRDGEQKLLGTYSGHLDLSDNGQDDGSGSSAAGRAVDGDGNDNGNGGGNGDGGGEEGVVTAKSRTRATGIAQSGEKESSDAEATIGDGEDGNTRVHERDQESTSATQPSATAPPPPTWALYCDDSDLRHSAYVVVAAAATAAGKSLKIRAHTAEILFRLVEQHSSVDGPFGRWAAARGLAILSRDGQVDGVVAVMRAVWDTLSAPTHKADEESKGMGAKIKSTLGWRRVPSPITVAVQDRLLSREAVRSVLMLTHAEIAIEGKGDLTLLDDSATAIHALLRPPSTLHESEIDAGMAACAAIASAIDREPSKDTDSDDVGLSRRDELLAWIITVMGGVIVPGAGPSPMGSPIKASSPNATDTTKTTPGSSTVSGDDTTAAMSALRARHGVIALTAFVSLSPCPEIEVRNALFVIIGRLYNTCWSHTQDSASAPKTDSKESKLLDTAVNDGEFVALLDALMCVLTAVAVGAPALVSALSLIAPHAASWKREVRIAATHSIGLALQTTLAGHSESAPLHSKLGAGSKATELYKFAAALTVRVADPDVTIRTCAIEGVQSLMRVCHLLRSQTDAAFDSGAGSELSVCVTPLLAASTTEQDIPVETTMDAVAGVSALIARSARPVEIVTYVEGLIGSTSDTVALVADASCVAAREALALPCPEIDFWVPRLLKWTLAAVGNAQSPTRKTTLLDGVVALARVHFSAVLQQLLAMPMSPDVTAGLGALAEDSQLLTQLMSDLLEGAMMLVLDEEGLVDEHTPVCEPACMCLGALRAVFALPTLQSYIDLAYARLLTSLIMAMSCSFFTESKHRIKVCRDALEAFFVASDKEGGILPLLQSSGDWNRLLTYTTFVDGAVSVIRLVCGSKPAHVQAIFESLFPYANHTASPHSLLVSSMCAEIVSHNKHLEAQLMCSLCGQHSRGSPPRVLPCLHSLCERCLESAMEGDCVACPTCGEGVKLNAAKRIKALPVDVWVGRLLELLAVREPQSVCCKCRDTARWRCEDCDSRLWCSDHGRMHRRDHPDHRMASCTGIVGAVGDSHGGTPAQLCNRHGDLPLKFYCEQCRQLLCRECADSPSQGVVPGVPSESSTEAGLVRVDTVAGHSSTHSVVPIDTAGDNVTSDLRKQLDGTTSALLRLNQRAAEVQRVGQAVETRADAVADDVRAHFAAMRAALDEREAALLQQVEDERSKKLVTLDNQRAELQTCAVAGLRSVEFATRLLAIGSGSEVLRMRSLVERRLSGIISQESGAGPRVGPDMQLRVNDEVCGVIREEGSINCSIAGPHSPGGKASTAEGGAEDREDRDAAAGSSMPMKAGTPQWGDFQSPTMDHPTTPLAKRGYFGPQV